MAYKMEAKHPQFPEETEFDCDGIIVPNGKTVTVTADMERAFYAKNHRSIKDLYGHSEIIKLTGTSELSSKEKQELEAMHGLEAVEIASTPEIDKPEEVTT